MSAAVILLWILLIGILACSLGVIAVRAIADDGSLRMLDMMRARGATLPQTWTRSSANQTALAARRCVVCGSKARCDESLACRDAAGYEAYCPNSGYIESLRS